ncbi:MAG: peptidase domain-containing ABC transporter [Candidatus Obscuribacterales bacterium]|nr:peptidase domain-containing ABC transporter [Candidatus Obscuribacterales bacterium]
MSEAEILKISSQVQLGSLFQVLNDNEFNALISNAEILLVSFGSTVFHAGDKPEHLYVLLSGKLRLTQKIEGKDETILSLNHCGEVFGSLEAELSADYTARASADSQLLKIANKNLDKLLSANAEFKAMIERNLQLIGWQQTLQQTGHFENISPESLRILLNRAERIKLASGASAQKSWMGAGELALLLSGSMECPDGEAIVAGQYLYEAKSQGTDYSSEQLPKAKSTCEILYVDGTRLASLFQDFIGLESELALYKKRISKKRDANLSRQTVRMQLINKLPAVQQQAAAQTQAKAETLLSKVRKKLGYYPILFQQNAMDCGSTCLAMVSLYYGQRVDLNKIRELANVGAQGTSLYALAEAAEALGFMSRGLSATYEGLCQSKLPLICFWKNEHFVVLYEIHKTHAIVGDPAEGLRKISATDFARDFSDFVLELAPTQQFGTAAKQQDLLKRLLPFVLPYKWSLVNVFVATLLYQTLMLIIPLFTQAIVDKVVVHQSISLLNTMTLGMAIFACFETIIVFIRGYVQSYLAIRLDQNLIIQFYRHLLSLPYKFFEDRTIGDIMARFGENQRLRDFLASSGITVILDVVVAIIYTAVIFSYNSSFALAMVLYLSVFTLLVIIYTPILRQLGRTVFNRYAESQSFLIESIRSIQLIKGSAAEHKTRWKWELLLAEQLEARFKELLANNTVQSLSRVVQMAGQIALLYLGASLVVKGQLTIGQLMALNMMVGMVAQPVMRIVEMWSSLQDVNVALERLCDVLDHDPEEADGSGKIIVDGIKGQIRLENVTFRYSANSATNALDNISFEIPAGKMAAFVGRSGCGKSTLLKLLQGLYVPNSGKVLIDGIDLSRISLSRFRQQTGVVSQNEYLFRGTVRENLLFNKQSASMQELVEAASIAGIHDTIMAMPMGYESQLSEGGFNLSGGQRQRMAIARAILHHPAILLFDEATSALDTESERQVQASMEQIRKDRTMIVVAHRLSTVKDADIIFVMDRGQIVESGTHESLIKAHGLYYYLCTQQLSA